MTRSRGVALITALVVVALGSLAATALVTSARVAIHRTAALRDSEQAWWIARGVQSWVLGILEADRNENRHDGLNEAWAQPVDHLPVEHGFVRGRVHDAQGCFNLNGLAVDPARGRDQTTQLREQHFERLLASLPEIQAPPGLVAAIRDWMDADQNTGFPAGAEDAAYLGLDPPYRAANRPFTVVSELLAIQGVTPELYAALRDHVCALPERDATINVNTASELVLRTLSAQTDENRLRQFLERRADKPAEAKAEVQDLFGRDAWNSFDVRSDYFAIRGDVFVGSSRVALYSLIHRPQTGAPTVLAQSADAE